VALPAAVHIQHRPLGFAFSAYPPAFHEHSDGNQDQSDQKDGGKNNVSKHPVVGIIMTGKQRLDKKNNDKYEAVNNKDSPNDADPIGNRFWHFHNGKKLKSTIYREIYENNYTYLKFQIRKKRNPSLSEFKVYATRDSV
jgi:hypothetical protein